MTDILERVTVDAPWVGCHDGAYVEEIPGQEFRVRSSVYVDPRVFADEMSQIFERTWIYVGHETEIPNPGDYRTAALGRVPVIVSRSDDGEIHVLLNICVHRGAAVCNSAKGNTRSFICPYHRWAYAPDGRLTAITDREGYPDGWKERMGGLRRAADVELYRGMIFARLHGGGESLRDFLGAAVRHIDKWFAQSPNGRVRVLPPTLARYPANWKFQVENSTDGLHPRFVHAGAFKVLEEFGLRDRKRGLLGVQRGFENGHGIVDRPLRRFFTPDAMADYRRVLGAQYGDEIGNAVAENGAQITIFPNFHLMEHRFRVIQPVSVAETIVYEYPVEFDGVPDAINEEIRARFTQEGGAMVGGFVNTDDVEMFCRMQMALSGAHVMEWVDWSRGMGKEHLEAEGEYVSESSYELSQRSYYREWHKRMSRV
jgi:phenylpropionate dioxygenase-like ring-hydroxylating dioxygenase large terminal subunit